jgi:2-hydroxy-6-oxonona-2,4-dienedioate hydrolase
MRVHFADIGGIPTRYFRAGRGAPVLLLHGVGLTADSWCRTIGPLSGSSDVIAPDLVGCGFTGPAPQSEGPPHDAILNHLEALLDMLELGSIAVVGSSLGATLAVLLYFRRPERISRIVIVSSGSVFKTAQALAAMYASAHRNGRAVLLDPTLETCRGRLANLFHDPSRIPTEILLLQLTPYALPHALEAFDRRMQSMTDVEAMRAFEIGHRLKSISVPVLALWGKQDPRGDYATALKTFSGLLNARFLALDECGHLPHLELPERFNSLVGEFLELDDMRRILP